MLRDGELTTAPPCPKELPEKPGYLFRLTLGLHPDIGDERTVTLELPASEKELEDAQERLGTLQWENTVVLDYDGIIPNAAIFADLPMEIEAFNEFAKAVKDIPVRQVQLPKAESIAGAVRGAGHRDSYPSGRASGRLYPHAGAELPAGNSRRPAPLSAGRCRGGAAAPPM